MRFPLFSGLLFCTLVFMTKHARAQQPTGSGKSTANSRVTVLDTAFYMPQLQRHRRIWVYLPAGYHQSRERYPVLYLQDGQNIFDAATSFSGEWGVDEALYSLEAVHGKTIVVGIDNGGDQRLSEYSPFDFTLGSGAGQQTIKAAGDAYADFLVNTLRPYLRRHFRVRRQGRHHFIAGSSMGGLIALYAILKAPRKWGGAGVFSPSFWVVRSQMLGFAEQKARHLKAPVYFYAGSAESDEMVPDMLRMAELLDGRSRSRVTTVIRAGNVHNEAAWRNEFPLFYKWLMQRHR